MASIFAKIELPAIQFATTGMTEKTIGSSGGGCLILILPIALLIVFLFATWPVLLGLAVLSVSLNAWQRYQWQQWSQQVNPIFHQLIVENRGSITPLDLAVKANFSAETAKRYLDTKAQEFAAHRQEYEDKGMVYHFITASTLGGIFDDSEPLSQSPKALASSTLQRTESQQSTAALAEVARVKPVEAQASGHMKASPPDRDTSTVSLIQAELAKRLDVHSSTVYKRRDDPDFPEWSRSRDPEGIAWKYSVDTREFVPLETEP